AHRFLPETPGNFRPGWSSIVDHRADDLRVRADLDSRARHKSPLLIRRNRYRRLLHSPFIEVSTARPGSKTFAVIAAIGQCSILQDARTSGGRIFSQAMGLRLGSENYRGPDSSPKENFSWNECAPACE